MIPQRLHLAEVVSKYRQCLLYGLFLQKDLLRTPWWDQSGHMLSDPAGNGETMNPKQPAESS